MVTGYSILNFFFSQVFLITTSGPMPDPIVLRCTDLAFGLLELKVKYDSPLDSSTDICTRTPETAVRWYGQLGESFDIFHVTGISGVQRVGRRKNQVKKRRGGEKGRPFLQPLKVVGLLVHQPFADPERLVSAL